MCTRETCAYVILEVNHSASLDQIKESRLRLIKLFHPDINKDPDATRRTQLINGAWDDLREPTRRKAHDRSCVLVSGRASRTAAHHHAAQRETEARARREAEAQVRREAETQARRAAEKRAQEVAREHARRKAEQRKQREAEERAKREAETRARQEAAEQARRQAQEAEQAARRAEEARTQRKSQEQTRERAKDQTEGDAGYRRPEAAVKAYLSDSSFGWRDRDFVVGHRYLGVRGRAYTVTHAHIASIAVRYDTGGTEELERRGLWKVWRGWAKRRLPDATPGNAQSSATPKPPPKKAAAMPWVPDAAAKLNLAWTDTSFMLGHWYADDRGAYEVVGILGGTVSIRFPNGIEKRHAKVSLWQTWESSKRRWGGSSKQTSGTRSGADTPPPDRAKHANGPKADPGPAPREQFTREAALDAAKAAGNEGVARYLASIKWVSIADKREKGGACWIIPTDAREADVRNVLNILVMRGYRFTYAKRGSRTTGGKAAWFFK